MANMTKLALFRQCAILFRTIPCEEVNAILIYLQMLETDADKSKFERIYVQYRGLMLRVANSILHNEQDAEDTIHQAFLAILNNLDKISAVDCPETQSYIVIITEHKASCRRATVRCCSCVSTTATARGRSQRCSAWSTVRYKS